MSAYSILIGVPAKISARPKLNSSLEVIYYWELENTGANHNKFYNIYICKDKSLNTVMVMYGRIGTVGTIKTKATRCDLEFARALAKSIMYQKRRKGYIIMENG